MSTQPNVFRRLRARAKRMSRGSILVLTLVIATGLSLMVSTLLQATIAETRLNQRNILKMEATNAAESATEYAISEMKMRWDNQATFPANQFVNNPITIPSDIKSWLWDGTDISSANVTIKVGLVPSPKWLYIDPADPANSFDPQRGKMVAACDVMVYAKAVAASRWGMETSYACQALEVRDAPLFAHAIFYNMDLEFHPGPAMTITGPVHANGDIWAVAQTALTFSGPITTSGNFNVGLIPWPTSWGSSSESSQTGNLVYIPNVAGGYTTPYKGTGSQQTSSSYFDSRQTSYNGTTFTNWRELSANRWGGNLQTSVNGVPDQKVTGYDDYVFKINGTSQDMNYAYAIIEPNQFNPATNSFHKGAGEVDKFSRKAGMIVKVLSMGTLTINTTNTVSGNKTVNSYKGDLTSNISTRMASANYTAIMAPILNTVNNMYQSGNITSGNIVLSTNATLSGNMVITNGTVQSITGNSSTPYTPGSSNTTAFTLLTQTQARTALGGTENALMENITSCTYNATNNTTTTSAYRVIGYARVEIKNVRNTVAGTGLRTPVYDTTTQVTNAYGDVIYPGDVYEDPIAVNATMIVGTYNATTGTVANGTLQDMLKFRPGVVNPGNTTDIWNGLQDQRRGGTGGTPVSTVDLDLYKLKQVVDDNVTGFNGTSGNFFTGSGNSSYNPIDKYNGVVYVQFPQLAGNNSRLTSVTAGNNTYAGDKITTSVDNAGLVVFNGTSNSTANITGVPYPRYNNPNISGNAAGRTPGFTLATNNCLYTYGNFNADGNMNTPYANSTANTQNNSTLSDNLTVPDPSCALVADSVTALSGNFLVRNSRQAKANLDAAPTEVNAAILTGIVPSTKSSSTQQSGGNHNFPRFLESWSSVIFRYRGSMVNLFESEIGNEAWSTTYYDPPTRQWGFFDQFARGVYPPGTPNARSYYRVNFKLLTKAEYDAATAGL